MENGDVALILDVNYTYVMEGKYMPENEFDIQEKETKQYISVKIGEEKFGIDIGYVDNIVRMQKITRVPKAAEVL